MRRLKQTYETSASLEVPGAASGRSQWATRRAVLRVTRGEVATLAPLATIRTRQLLWTHREAATPATPRRPPATARQLGWSDGGVATLAPLIQPRPAEPQLVSSRAACALLAELYLGTVCDSFESGPLQRAACRMAKRSSSFSIFLSATSFSAASLEATENL